MTLFSLTHLHPLPVIKKRCRRSAIHHKKKMEKKEMRRRIVELKVEMEEISEEQEMIKQGQIRVGEKLEVVEQECDKLRKETDEIMQQTTHTQLRLLLMFQILKAREDNDFTRAAYLTHLLREIIATWV